MKTKQKPSIIGLKRMLPTEEEFSKTMSYFLDIAETNPSELMDDSHLADENTREIFRQVLNAVMQKLSGKTRIVLSEYMCVEVPKAQFLHGCAFHDNRIINYFYFADLDRGLIAASVIGGTRVDYARVTALANRIMKPKPPDDLN